MEVAFQENQTCRKWSTVLGLFLILCPLGIVWYWGNLFVYTESYLIKETSASKTPHGPWMMSCFEVGTIAGIFLSALMVRAVGKRLTTFLGEVFFISGYIGSYFVIQESAVVMNCMLGAVTGLGLYLVNGVVMMFTLEWSAGDFGLIHSMVQAGMTTGAVVVNQMITLYVNPDNLSPDMDSGKSKYFTQDEVVENVRPFFLVLIVTIAACYFLGISLVRDNTEYVPVVKNESKDVFDRSVEYASSFSALYGSNDKIEFYKKRFDSASENSINSTELGKGEKGDNSSLSPRQIIRCPIMYVYCILTFLGSTTYITVTTYYKTYGQLYIKDDHFLTNVSIALLITVTFGRIGWGKLLDKHGLKSAFILLFAGSALSSLCFYFAPQVNKWCYTASILAFSCFGTSIYVVGAFAVVKTFGESHFVLNVGIVFLPGSFIILLSSQFFEYLLANWGWFAVFGSCAFWNLAGLIISILMLPENQR